MSGRNAESWLRVTNWWLRTFGATESWAMEIISLDIAHGCNVFPEVSKSNLDGMCTGSANHGYLPAGMSQKRIYWASAIPRKEGNDSF